MNIVHKVFKIFISNKNLFINEIPRQNAKINGSDSWGIYSFDIGSKTIILRIILSLLSKLYLDVTVLIKSYFDEFETFPSGGLNSFQ